MAVKITENWKEETYTGPTQSARGSAEKVLLVTGVDDIAGALEAALSVWPVNTPHPVDSGLFSAVPIIGLVGFKVFRCRIPFGFGTQSASNPLLMPLKIRWEPGVISEPSDRDAYGNPFANSAGDAFDPPMQAEVYSWFYTITRFETRFDNQTAFAYQGKLNSNSFTIAGAGSVEPGQVRCLTIAPASEYALGDSYIPIAYKFELRRGRVKDTADGLWDGFKERRLDAGRRGVWDTTVHPPGVGELFDKNGAAQVSQDVRLDSTGGPLSDNYIITATNKTKSPITLPPKVTAESATDEGGNIIAWYLKFARYETADFSGIGI